MVENVVSNEWICAKESRRGLILGIATKFAALARESHCSSVGIVLPAAHIRTKHPPHTNQKLHCLQCLAGCDL